VTTLSASVHEWSVGRRASGFVQVFIWKQPSTFWG
jgi:hypothetical protein